MGLELTRRIFGQVRFFVSLPVAGYSSYKNNFMCRNSRRTCTGGRFSFYVCVT